MAFGLGDDIHAEIHPVNEIDVGVAGWTEHYFRPRSAASRRMRRKVVRSEVGFGLDDPADAFNTVDDMDEAFPEQFPGDDDGVAVVESARQFLHCDLKGRCIMPRPMGFAHQEFFGFSPWLHGTHDALEAGMKTFTQLFRGVIATMAVTGLISIASAQTTGGGSSGGGSGSTMSGTSATQPGSSRTHFGVAPGSASQNTVPSVNPTPAGVVPPTVPPPGSVPPGPGNAAMTNASTPFATNGFGAFGLTNQMMSTSNAPSGMNGTLGSPPR